jgi:hypothetical protein
VSLAKDGPARSGGGRPEVFPSPSVAMVPRRPPSQAADLHPMRLVEMLASPGVHDLRHPMGGRPSPLVHPTRPVEILPSPVMLREPHLMGEAPGHSPVMLREPHLMGLAPGHSPVMPCEPHRITPGISQPYQIRRPPEMMSYPLMHSMPMDLWQTMPAQPLPRYVPQIPPDFNGHSWRTTPTESLLMPPGHLYEMTPTQTEQLESLAMQPPDFNGHSWRMAPTESLLTPTLPELLESLAMQLPSPLQPGPSKSLATQSVSGSKPTWMWDWEVGGKLVERSSSLPDMDHSAVPAGRPSGSNIEEEKQDERWIVGSTASHALPSTSNRPLPHSCPPFPKGGSQEKITEWNRACLRIYKLGANGCLVCSYS